MSIVKMDSEVIAEIKNALCVIQGNADIIGQHDMPFWVLRSQISEQVKRIDSLLPKVSFEGK